MPKIPTFGNRLRRGTITGEAASVPSGIQLSDQDNLALSVLRGSKEALDYFAVQKDNENKTKYNAAIPPANPLNAKLEIAFIFFC